MPVSRTAIKISYSGRCPFSSKVFPEGPGRGVDGPERGVNGPSALSFECRLRARFAVTETSTSPPASVNFAELLSRLVKIWRNRTSSAQIQLQKQAALEF
jgi:hypothetical protein